MCTFDNPLKAFSCNAVILLSFRFKWSRFLSNFNALVGTSLSRFFDNTRWLRVAPCDDILAVPNPSNSVIQKRWNHSLIFLMTEICFLRPHAKQFGYLVWTYCNCGCINAQFSFPWIYDQQVLEYYRCEF